MALYGHIRLLSVLLGTFLSFCLPLYECSSPFLRSLGIKVFCLRTGNGQTEVFDEDGNSGCTSIGNGCFLAEPSCEGSDTATSLPETTKPTHVEIVTWNYSTTASTDENTNQTLTYNDYVIYDELFMKLILAGVPIPIIIFCMLCIFYRKVVTGYGSRMLQADVFVVLRFYGDREFVWICIGRVGTNRVMECWRKVYKTCYKQAGYGQKWPPDSRLWESRTWPGLAAVFQTAH
uniref:Uncharacterized protein n=1 Tax=Magallana gigas TaxID=29159 RepID=K1QLR1_MAGGI